MINAAEHVVQLDERTVDRRRLATSIANVNAILRRLKLFEGNEHAHLA